MDAVRGGVDPDPGPPLPADEVRAETVALLALRGLPGMGFVTTERMLEAFGSGRGGLEASRAAFADVAGEEAAAARSDPGRVAEAERVVECMEAEGVRVVPRGSADYPARLLHLAQPPAVLFFRGDMDLLTRRMVAVVGSRRSTGYGRRVASEVARVLSAHGVVVGSGLALGIDAAAHRATLEAGGATLAVLGSGMDVPHPPSNRGLFRRIGRDGLLVTEFSPGTPPHRSHFPARNRILAALARGVLVVEAGERSGAKITAKLALEIGRSVMAVPGSIFSQGSRGTHDLLFQGALGLYAPEDVLELAGLGSDGQGELPFEPVGVGRDGRALWTALGGRALAVDELTRAAGLPSDRALAALASLELGGWVDRQPGMRFVRRFRPAPRAHGDVASGAAAAGTDDGASATP